MHTPDGLALAAALYVPNGSGPFPAVLLSHMGGATKETWQRTPSILQQAGYLVLTYDFRGHGQSEGRLDPPSAAIDVNTALAFLRSHPQVDEGRIALVGASMGGLASVIVAARDPDVRAVVAISTSPDAAGQYPGQVIHLLSPRPFLTIGCDEDPITKPERVRQLYEAAGTPRQIVILPCAAHANDILETAAGPRLLNQVLSWLDDYVKITSHPPELVSPTPSSSPSTVGPPSPWFYETSVTIPTYAYERGFQTTGPDDLVYPYPRLDFSQVGPPTPRAYRAIVLENSYLSLTILPELGGRVYGWLDKTTGRQLLYQNPVIKPTQWGYRGWWLAAGGIEWAFPVEEHGLNEWRPWSYTVGHSDHGLSVTVSDVEDRTGVEVGVTISLDAAHAYVTFQPWARNNTSEAHQYELWLNAMLTLGGNSVSDQTQFIIPADQVTVHSTGDGGLPGPWASMTWPIYGGRDMSWYSNWDGYLGFFAPTVSSGFVGLYDHGVDQGIVRAFEPGWPAGTKFFGPSNLSPSLWTDDGSSYVELWSGATSSFGSQATLYSGESVGWTERWYPVNGLGGFNYANESAALRLTDDGGSTEIGVAVSASTTGNVTLWTDGQLAGSWPLSLSPGQAFRVSWTRPPNAAGALGLRLEDRNGVVIAQMGQVP